MDIRKNALKNGLYSIITQLVAVPMQFILRYATLHYIGVELLGVNGTMASIIGFLSLAEGGVGSAIIYSLYKPLAENNIVIVNKLMNIYKSIYNVLGIGIMVIGILILPFIHIFLKGVTMTPRIYILFLLNCLNSASSYFLGYKRSLFYADIKDYLAKRADIVCNIIFSVLNIYFIFITKSIIVYSIVLIMKTITSNVIISFQYNKLYPYLKKDKIDTILLKQILSDAKNLFMGSVAGYVYKSTDNILVSSFSSTVNVGYLSNYTLISTNVKNITIQFLNSFTPVIGRKLSEYKIYDEKRKLFYIYNQLCYIFGYMVCVPTYALLESFISNCWGKEFLMDSSVCILLVLEMYIYIVQSANGVFIVASGKFRLLRIVEITGAFLNLTISLVLVYFMDVTGVLLGTVISTAIQWIIRSYGVCTDILKYKRKCYARWVILELYKLFLLFCSIKICVIINEFLTIRFYFVEFVLMGVISIIISIIVYEIFYYGSDKISFHKLKIVLADIKR